MGRLAQAFYEGSRSRRNLWAASLAVLGAGLAVAYFWGQRAAQPSDRVRDLVSESAYTLSVSELGAEPRPGLALETFLSCVKDRRFEEWNCLEAMPTLANLVPEARWPEIVSAMDQRFGAKVGALSKTYLEAAFDKDSPARERLKELADGEPPTQYANRILGQLALSENLNVEAAGRFAKEGQFANEPGVREQAVDLFLDLDDYDSLKALARDPRFADAIDDHVRLRLAIEERDWAAVALYLARNETLGWSGGLLALTLLTGAVWAAILLQIGQFSGGRLATVLLGSAAIALGIASGIPTLLGHELARVYLDLEPNGRFLHDLGFYVVSVGIREEFCKLLLFLPLAPILARRGDELEMLVMAGLVGLGFAIGENFGYVESSFGSSAPVRLLTANFFHVGMTGLCGLYLCRAFAIRGYGFSHFLSVFGLVVLAHGAYDAFFSLPELAEFSFLAYTVYVLLSMRFFAEAHALREPGRSPVSLSAMFSVGMAIVVAASTIYMTRFVGFGEAMNAIAPGLLSVGLIAFMFFREFREELHA